MKQNIIKFILLYKMMKKTLFLYIIIVAYLSPPTNHYHTFQILLLFRIVFNQNNLLLTNVENHNLFQNRMSQGKLAFKTTKQKRQNVKQLDLITNVSIHLLTGLYSM